MELLALSLFQLGLSDIQLSQVRQVWLRTPMPSSKNRLDAFKV